MCHTATPVNNVSKVLKGANSPSTIQSAINANTGGMGFLKSTLSTQDVSDIAAYLATPTL
jgi:mono/diheme cytochrome c family protein